MKTDIRPIINKSHQVYLPNKTQGFIIFIVYMRLLAIGSWLFIMRLLAVGYWPMVIGF